MRCFYAVATTSFLLMLGGSALAQTQPDPACKVEGPSVADTLTYLNDSLANAEPARPFYP